MGVIAYLAIWGISTAVIFGMLEVVVLICSFVTGRWASFLTITSLVLGAATACGWLSSFIYLTESKT